MLIKSSFQYFLSSFYFSFFFWITCLFPSVLFSFENPRFRYSMSKNDFQSNVKHISLQSASRLVSHRKITPSKVRTIRKFCQKFEEMGKGEGKFGGFRLMGTRKGGTFFQEGKAESLKVRSTIKPTSFVFSYSSSPSSSSSSYRIFFCLFFLFIHLLYFYSSSSYSSSS